jgi:hypothetical protein
MNDVVPLRRRLAPVAGAAILLALYYVMAVSAAAQKSQTFDELAHLTAGYTYWAFDDYRLHPENGNWPQRLAALPAVLGGAAFPTLAQPSWTRSDIYAVGDQYLFASGNDADTLLQRGRAVMALAGVALGALVFAWSRRLTSPLGGWVSLVLFVFSPTFLAHGALATSDIMSALFFTAATGAMWVALHRVTPFTVLGAGVLLAGAFLSKLSAPILVPVVVVMLAVRAFARRPIAAGTRGNVTEYTGAGRQAAILLAAGVVVAVIVVALVWASFGFRYTAFAAATTGKDSFLASIPERPGISGRLLAEARALHLLPEAYLYGSRFMLQSAAERASFLNGEYSTTGWWWYFPYAFAVKTTIPGLLMGLLAAAAIAFNRTAIRLYDATPLAALVLDYGAFALTTNLNIGHRHLLPIYPALCIFAGAAAFWVQSLVERPRAAMPARTGRERRQSRTAPRGTTPSWRKGLGVAVVALLAWHAAESLAIRPDYLAYFNQFAGGPSQGYRHLADSSLDWGQDLPALKAWLDAQGLQQPNPNVYLSYFGTARPEYYGIRSTRLMGFLDRRPPEPPPPLAGGVYCMSATILDVVSHIFYSPDTEQAYQAAVKNLTVFAQASQDEHAWAALIQQTGDQFWRDLFVQFDQMRTGRLAAFLRQREPDAQIGHSILVYRLSDADVDRAVNGPAPPAR